MKKQENKLDALLRQKLEGMEGEVSPHDWTAISERLDKEEKAPRGIFAGGRKYLFALIFLFIGAVATYFVAKNSSGNSSNQEAVSSRKTIDGRKKIINSSKQATLENAKNSNNSNSSSERVSQSENTSGKSNTDQN